MNQLHPKVIHTDVDHRAALDAIDQLWGAKPGSPEADTLELLGKLVAEYEEERFPIGVPSPIEAIRFRMEQLGLKAKDLYPYLGGSARTSEVLGGKRALTLSMIRALHAHLGIPAEALITEPLPESDDSFSAFLDRMPGAAMASQGFFGPNRKVPDDLERAMRDKLGCAGLSPGNFAFLCRKTDATRENAKTDMNALLAWMIEVQCRAGQKRLAAKYVDGTIDDDFMREVARLSRLPDGPKVAERYLAQHGIHLVYVPPLPKTYLDGACMKSLKDGNPVIGMTIRYDRIDNFWFVVLHELAHLKNRDLETMDGKAIVDDFDVPAGDSVIERRADREASEAAVPADVLQPYLSLASAANIEMIARRYRVHPAIVAGQVRHRTGDYRKFARMIGQGEVRKQFAG